MAELEIHHEEGSEGDPFGKKVGVLAGVLAVALAIVTIASHRAHTEAVVLKSEVNDTWSYYQSKKLKSHTLELGKDLLAALGANNEQASKTIERYESEIKRYDKETEDIQGEAKKKESETLDVEHRALRYDIGEGLLEIGLVLSSLYFIARKKMFPAVGILAGILGTAVALSGLFMK